MLRGLDFCYVYIDDVLIASRTTEEHKVHIRLVQRFVQYGMHTDQSYQVCLRCHRTTLLGSSCQQRWCISISRPGASYPELSSTHHTPQTMGVPRSGKLLPPMYTQEAIPIPDSTADTVAQATITTDRGQQFESALWTQLTSYHPIANGLVERLHRQLKSAVKYLPDPTYWTKALPLVLLGIRTTIKQDLKCTAAELVYGTTLRLPGEFFTSTTNHLDPISYATQLKTFMQQLKPPSVCRQQRHFYTTPDLSTCTFVFVRHDAVKRSLQKPYDGPFHVLHCSDKHFTLDISGKKKVVSIDRLKLAHIEEAFAVTNLSVTVPQPSQSDTSPPLNSPPSKSSPTSRVTFTLDISGKKKLFQ